MYILDSTVKSLEIKLDGAIITNELDWTVSYVDLLTTDMSISTTSENDGKTTGATAVTMIAAPASNHARQLKALSVYNLDTGEVIVTIQINDNATKRVIWKGKLAVGDTLQYGSGSFIAFASNGQPNINLTSMVTGILPPQNGGTGIANNAASLLTISGAYALTLAVTGATSLILPTTGILATLAGTEELTGKTLTSSVGKGTWTASGTWVLPSVTMGGHLLFTDASYDIGQSGATRPRHLYLSGDIVFAGSITGSGAALTSLTAANVSGSHTLPDGVLSTNVPLLNASNVFTGANQTISAANVALILTKTLAANYSAVVFKTATDNRWFFGTNGDDTFKITSYVAGVDVIALGSGGTMGIRIAANATVGLFLYGTGTTSGTYGVLIRDSGGTDNMYVRDDGYGYLRAAQWVYGSDRRMKERVTYFSIGLKVVKSLRPAKFDCIGGEKDQYGFIAQDVQDIIPQAVSITNPETGMLGLATDFIVPFTINAIKELDARVTALEQCSK